MSKIRVPPGASDGTKFPRIYASMVGWTHSVLAGLYGHYGHYGLSGRYGWYGPLVLYGFMEFMDAGAAHNLRTFCLRAHVY